MISTPSVCPYSGWPGVSEPHVRSAFRSSSSSPKPPRYSCTYCVSDECPAERMNRSRPTQCVSAGSWRSTRWYSRYAAGARLIAVPGWPLPTFSTASAASTRAVSTARLSISSQRSSDTGPPFVLERSAPRSAHAAQPSGGGGGGGARGVAPVFSAYRRAMPLRSCVPLYDCHNGNPLTEWHHGCSRALHRCIRRVTDRSRSSMADCEEFSPPAWWTRSARGAGARWHRIDEVRQRVHDTGGDGHLDHGAERRRSALPATPRTPSAAPSAPTSR